MNPSAPACSEPTRRPPAPNSVALAAASDFVDALVKGLDTIVGERVAGLSSGERQRITIAQALVRIPCCSCSSNPPQVLDAASERRVAAALASPWPRITVMAMTHRSEPAKHADNMALLRSGRIAAAGRWSELEPRIKNVATATGQDGSLQ